MKFFIHAHVTLNFKRENRLKGLLSTSITSAIIIMITAAERLL